MKKGIFWKSYGIYVATLLILMILAVASVTKVLVDYEAAQPEKAVEAHIETIKDAIVNGTLEESMLFAELNTGDYDVADSDVEEFKNKVKNAKELSYKVKTGGYSETEKSFYILADDEVIAEITLESSNEQIVLAILTVSDWNVKSVTPAFTNYAIDVPKGFEITVNGTALTNPEESSKEGWERYVVKMLVNDPEVKIHDPYGMEVRFHNLNGQITPVVYSYELTFPKGFTVAVGECVIEGVEDGENMLYAFSTASDVLKLADAHGNTMDYKSGDSVYVYDYVVTIPDNFKISINGKDASGYITETKVNEKYQYCAEHVEMPKQVTYSMNDILVEPKCEIYDNLNQKVDYVFVNNSFVISEQVGGGEIPADVADKDEMLEIAQTWSKFMTDDLDGSQHGFATMKKYLIKDSYLYKVAYRWATSIDITFTSNHILEDPAFTDVKIGNYINYGNNVFSCDISFKKHMFLVKTKEQVIDEMNSTFYFMLYDGTKDGKDNPTWVILDIREIISK